MVGEFFGEKILRGKMLYKSKYYRFLNCIFIKQYSSNQAIGKIYKERQLYYDFLTKAFRNLTDFGLIIKINNSCFWIRRMRKGTFLQNNALSSSNLEQTVEKLLEIHNFNIPDKIHKTLGTSQNILTWFDNQNNSSLLEEWTELQKTNQENNCLVHGDFQPKKHLLVNNEKIEIIDFGDSFLGQPSVDLGALACSNPELFDRFFESYSQKCKKAISIEMVRFWKKYFETSNIFWMNYKFGTNLNSRVEELNGIPLK